MGLKLGNHRMDLSWCEDRYSWLSDDGRPIGPFQEEEKSKLADELDGMTDIEYEQKLDENNELYDIDVTLDFKPDEWFHQEVEDLIINGQWMAKFESRRVHRAKQFDPLLQKTTKLRRKSRLHLPRRRTSTR